MGDLPSKATPRRSRGFTGSQGSPAAGSGARLGIGDRCLDQEPPIPRMQSAPDGPQMAQVSLRPGAHRRHRSGPPSCARTPLRWSGRVRSSEGRWTLPWISGEPRMTPSAARGVREESRRLVCPAPLPLATQERKVVAGQVEELCPRAIALSAVQSAAHRSARGARRAQAPGQATTRTRTESSGERPGSTALNGPRRVLAHRGATRVPISSMALISFSCGNEAAFI